MLHIISTSSITLSGVKFYPANRTMLFYLSSRLFLVRSKVHTRYKFCIIYQFPHVGTWFYGLDKTSVFSVLSLQLSYITLWVYCINLHYEYKYSIYSYIWTPKNIYYYHHRQFSLYDNNMDYMCYVSVHSSHLCYLSKPQNKITQTAIQQILKKATIPQHGHHFWTIKSLKTLVTDLIVFCSTEQWCIYHVDLLNWFEGKKFNFVHSDWNNPATWKIFSFRVFSFSTYSFMNLQSPGKFAEWFCSEIFRNLSSTTDQPSWLLFMALTFNYWKPFSAL